MIKLNRNQTLSGPQIYLTGASYDATPLPVREKLSISKARIQEALESLEYYVNSGVILSTCNRTEVYAIGTDGHSPITFIQSFLCDWSGLSQEELDPILYKASGYDAIRHLTETTAGLRSMIVGEWEIQGQVKQALQAAEDAGMADPFLGMLFHHAIQVGRRVRDETDISKNALSVSSVAVNLAAKRIGDVHRCKVVLLGAGQAGKLVARAFSQRGVADLSILNRSLQGAEELAAALGGRAVKLGNLQREMEAADIVISCTGAPHAIVNSDIVRKVMTARPVRPLVIVDIAVPRDVDPKVKRIDGVTLYDIDDFIKVSKTHRKAREEEIDKALGIIDEEMSRFIEQWHAISVKPVVDALMQKADVIRQRQLQFTLKKLPPLSQEELANIEAMTKSIVNKLLHNPVKCLRNNGHNDDVMVEVVKELFDIDTKALSDK